MVLTVPIGADILDDEPAPLEEASSIDDDDDRSLDEIVRSLDFSEANSWDPRDSFKHRFNFDGLLLWDLIILQKYVKDDHAAFPVFKKGSKLTANILDSTSAVHGTTVMNMKQESVTNALSVHMDTSRMQDPGL